MDITEKVLSEIRDASKMHQELNDGIEFLRAYVAIEERNLAYIECRNEHSKYKCENIIKMIDSLEEQEKFLIENQSNNNKVILRQLYFKCYAERMEPSRDELNSAFNRLQEGYLKLISNYENNSEYSQVLEAEAVGKQLSQLIIEKRNEYMRLEAAEHDLD